MFHSKPNDPFEEESFPKAFYYPSLEKDLSNHQRKICLSPGDKIKKDSEKVQSKKDVLFLRGSNKLSSHEVPTHEDGTSLQDSSGSQFNESWPSTDKNVSSLLSRHTSPSSPVETCITTKQSNVPLLDQNGSSTLSKYVERFRHGAPASRTLRNSTNTKDFWWLSPPSSSSTPKETSTTSSVISASDVSPKKTRKLPNKKLLPKTRGLSSRSLREIVEEQNEDNLQTRTDILLEKSENTLSDISTPESLPKPPSSWMLEKQKRQELKDVSHGSVTRPRLAPEDDILYQWRLARKLERAQEQAKSGHVKQFPNFSRQGASSTLANDVFSREAYKTERNVGYTTETGGGPNILETMKTQKPTKCISSPNMEKDSKDSNIFAQERAVTGRTLDNREQEPTRIVNNYKTLDKRKRCVERSVIGESLGSNVPIVTDVPGVCFVQDSNLPPHIHMMCDIVPCSARQPQKSVFRESSRIKCTSQNAPTMHDTESVPGAPRVVERNNINIEQNNTNNVSENDTEKAGKDAYSPVDEKSDKSSPNVERGHLNNQNENRLQQDVIINTEAKEEEEEERSGNENMIGNVIGQVISERLFSSMSVSSRHSSASDFSDQCVNEEKETHITNTNITPEGPEDSGETKEIVSIPEDEILVRLQKQADFYQKHLRNIDRLLDQIED